VPSWTSAVLQHNPRYATYVLPTKAGPHYKVGRYQRPIYLASRRLTFHPYSKRVTTPLATNVLSNLCLMNLACFQPQEGGSLSPQGEGRTSQQKGIGPPFPFTLTLALEPMGVSRTFFHYPERM